MANEMCDDDNCKCSDLSGNGALSIHRCDEMRLNASKFFKNPILDSWNAISINSMKNSEMEKKDLIKLKVEKKDRGFSRIQVLLPRSAEAPLSTWNFQIRVKYNLS